MKLTFCDDTYFIFILADVTLLFFIDKMVVCCLWCGIKRNRKNYKTFFCYFYDFDMFDLFDQHFLFGLMDVMECWQSQVPRHKSVKDELYNYDREEDMDMNIKCDDMSIMSNAE